MSNEITRLQNKEDRTRDEIRWARREMIKAQAAGNKEAEAKMAEAYKEEKQNLAEILEAIEEAAK